MNFVQLLPLALQVASVLQTVAQSQGLKFKSGDAAVYLAARELAAQLERRNPGIAQVTGYVKGVNE